jgi:gamma-glutamyltranspeptidase/glutathione hydrolase
VGGEHPIIDTSGPPGRPGDHDPLVQGLRKLGHQVDLADQSSGLSAITRAGPSLIGGADPRREGLVMGDVG